MDQFLYLLQKNLNKKLTDEEKQYVKSRLVGVSFESGEFKQIVKDIVVDICTGQIAYEDQHEQQKATLGTTSENSSTNDLRYLQKINKPDSYNKKLTVSISKFLSHCNTDLFALSTKLNPTSKYVYSYITLDTNNLANPNRPTETVGLFWYLNYNAPPRYETGVINIHTNLNNSVAMRLARTSFSSIIASNATIQNTDVAFGFKEFDAWSFVHNSGFRYQFVQTRYVTNPPLYYLSQWNGSSIVTTAFEQNHGWIRFNNPYNPPPSLTLTIKTIPELTTIPMSDTPLSVSAVQLTDLSYVNDYLDPPAFYNPIFIDMPDASRITLTSSNFSREKNALVYAAYFSVSYDLFEISGFTTDDPVADAAVIAAYNGTHRLYALSNNTVGTQTNTAINWYQHPVDISTCTFFTTDPVPITITWLTQPRILVSVEIISLLPDGEKIN